MFSIITTVPDILLGEGILVLSELVAVPLLQLLQINKIMKTMEMNKFLIILPLVESKL